ncbi:MAG TPA: Gfo/Idh/MocA family oxidoreductase [Candidatus Hydrogenedentes bacterium]|nr:Gfo/Idh/MocA family oxidoreductase [Candidatus Hydrogenedentota bacterium]
MTKQSISRRQFIQRAAGIAAFPSLIPISALGRPGIIPPSERITIGCIGLGGMGRGDMNAFMGSPNAQVVAVCDVKPDARAMARDMVNKHYGGEVCTEYVHFEELVARDDIDAVLIASNDHWHVLHALAAVRSGKDVYVEKPLGMSIEEVQTLRAAIRQYGRVFQFGTQQRSSQEFRRACELVRNGRIGKLKNINVGVHAGAAERSGLKTFTAAPIPAGFDYDLWLGPAPVAPFIPQRVINPHWFHISDYSLGYITGWGIHHMDIAQWGHGTELTGPIEITGTAKWPTDDALCDNPILWDVHYRYADGVTLHFTGAGPGLEGVRHGIMFEGGDGWVWVNRGGLEASPKELLLDSPGATEIRLPASTSHHQDLLDCIYSRADTISNIEVASRSDILCQLGWIAFTLNRPLRWDPDHETFPDDPEANHLLRKNYREPWHL